MRGRLPTHARILRMRISYLLQPRGCPWNGSNWHLDSGRYAKTDHREHLDVLVKDADRTCAIELKYKTRKLDTVFGRRSSTSAITARRILGGTISSKTWSDSSAS